jgi:hypothetical protein
VALVTVEQLKSALAVGDLYPDEDLEQVADAASNVLASYLIPLEDPDSYDEVPEVCEAALAIAVELWQSRLAPGGTLQGVDFAPSPFRLGRSLLSKVSGLIGQHIDTAGMVG